MKFLILFLISFNLFAVEQYADCSKNSVLVNGPMAKQACGESCLPILEKPFDCSYAKIVEAYNTKVNAQSCESEEDCQAKFVSLACEGLEMPIKNLDLMEVYCTEYIVKHYAIDNALKSSIELANAAKAAQENALKSGMEAMDKGKEIIALMAVRNVQKGLTSAQVTLFLETFKDVKSMLETGSLATAKEAINLISPDGSIVTSEDKAAIISAIDTFLGK